MRSTMKTLIFRIDQKYDNLAGLREASAVVLIARAEARV